MLDVIPVMVPMGAPARDGIPVELNVKTELPHEVEVFLR
jgi:hypothetical protein